MMETSKSLNLKNPEWTSMSLRTTCKLRRPEYFNKYISIISHFQALIECNNGNIEPLENMNTLGSMEHLYTAKNNGEPINYF